MRKKTQAIVVIAATAVCFLALLFVFFAVGCAHYGCVDDGCRICCMLDALGGMLDELLMVCFALRVGASALVLLQIVHPICGAQRQTNPVLLRVRLLN